MKVILAGEGAIARRHLAALQRIEGIEVVGLAGGDATDTAQLATEFSIPLHTLDLGTALAPPGVEAAILASPTPLHASQAIQVMESGKHVLIEIPMADNLADAESIVAAQERTGVTAMACHTRRFNPSHQWVHQHIESGDLGLQHLVVETFFFRRENRNALGKPRTWTDHLLWHHACHTVDLFQYQTGELPLKVLALQGPPHPELGIAMDMAIGLQAPSGALCSLALSFNNDGPFGTFFRYIGDSGTYIASYDDLVDGNDKPIDVSMFGYSAEGPDPLRAVAGGRAGVSLDGIELQDREFFAAIHQDREANASVAQCLPAMQTLDRIERML
jgi:2-hydroxy-4-carboxymuconate semialdehyde hemiacetal dehydrogenase